MKIIILLFFVFLTSSLFASEFSYLSRSEKCFIGKINKNKIEEVAKDSFLGIKLFTKAYPKNKKYDVFKYKKEIYITPSICLVKDDLPSFEKKENPTISHLKGDQEEALPYYEEVSEPLNSKKYYFNFNIGKPFYTSNNTMVDDYSSLLGTSVKVKEVGTYDPSFLYDLSLGMKQDSGNYLFFKFKYLKAAKEDKVAASGGEATFKFMDTNYSFLFGKRFIFWKINEFSSFFSLAAGLNYVTQTIEYKNLTTSKIGNYELSAMTFDLLLEGGVDYQLTDSLSFNGTLGYEYVGKRKYSFKAKKDAQKDEYTSPFNFSNISLTFGLTYFF